MIPKAWADASYKKTLIEHAATRGIDLEIVHRTAPSRISTVQPRRWVIGHTPGWLMHHHRRLARDYETLPARSAVMIHLSMIDLMSRRLAGEATPNWRGI
ncbi:transposase [Streptomyces calidiresistens]|uniref:Transposase n=1 Tax=Streptomyces calidiresistens TaxID=1485586 RepID=A0A7W3T0K7_9ACTN|nr:transposase [Streptomyces calidiresistens]